MKPKQWLFNLSFGIFIWGISTSPSVWFTPDYLIAKSPFFLLCLSMPLVMAARRLDWSIGANVMFSSQAAWLSYLETGSSVAGCLGGILAGSLVGIFNGYMAGFLRLHSLLVTLASSLMLHHIYQMLNMNHPSGDRKGFWDQTAMHIEDVGFTSVHLFMGVLFICGALVYTFSNLKTYAIALGQDPQQLRRWGRHPASVLLILFGFQGILAGAAGSMLSTLPPDFIAGSEHQLSLSVLSICLLSGLGFQGGRPQMHRVMMALLAILSLEQLFLKLSLSHHWQGALHSSILLLALMIQQREQEH